jgi:transcriptional regulator GlxA family with amidase domain
MIRNVVAVTDSFTAGFELGVVGEVFGVDRTADGLPGYEFAVCAEAPGAIPTTSGYAIQVEHGLDRIRDADLVVIPAWSLTGDASEAVIEALRDAHERGAVMLSVCSGAFALALAGLLDDRRATTHWKWAPHMRERFPRVLVDVNALYIDEGQLITGAGTAAGIDACLHLVRREQGAAVANAIARRMVVPPQRRGGQAQFIETTPAVEYHRDQFADVLAWAQECLAEPLSIADLAARAHMSPRTFARRFREIVGSTPHQWLLDQRLRAAEELLERTNHSVESVARAVGLGSSESMRRHFLARRGVSPAVYRQNFRFNPTNRGVSA